MTGYSTVTELPGNGAPREQHERLFHRYRFASTYCDGKDVLEVACGAGQGLGYIARKAGRVVGVDIDEEILRFPREHYKGRENIEIRQMDAQELSFPDGSFDVVIMHEAIYYLPEAGKFVDEARRVLRDGGTLIVCTVNSEWPDFNPSPFSTKYFSGPELCDLLRKKGFEVEMFAAFRAATNTLKDRLTSLIKRTAVKLHLMPKTMKGKEFLKRIFFGKLSPLPYEVKEDMAGYIAPISIPCDVSETAHKVLYAVARVA